MATTKISPLNALLAGQFLSAFVDNMILFITAAIITRDSLPLYYLPMVQAVFLLSYIVLSPWVGKFADKNPKSTVLIVGNAIKLMGIFLFICHVNPVVSYAFVGIGAVIYSPAKYGILPILTNTEQELLKANSKIESFTILAILLGSVVGGFLADKSISISLWICALLYVISILCNKIIPKDAGNKNILFKNPIGEFKNDVITLFGKHQSHFSLIGTGAFWMSSAVLRMAIFVWVPLVLGITTKFDISMIIAVTGVGLAVGAVATPRIIDMEHYHKTTYFGLSLSLLIFALTFVHSLPITIILLLLVGFCGGVFIVPMNASLQKTGIATIGAGKTIAIQNFVENTFMFMGVSLYTLGSKQLIPINTSLIVLGIVMLLFIAYLFSMGKSVTEATSYE